MAGTADRRRPLQEGLYTWPSARPQLIASKCKACGELTFPKQDSCPSCTERGAEEVLLSRRGKLWTWTVQHFPPPHPYAGDLENFVPFGVGYVELAEGLRVESRLTENDPERLRIGMEMEMVIEQFGEDGDGNQLVTFAFRPTGN